MSTLCRIDRIDLSTVTQCIASTIKSKALVSVSISLASCVGIATLLPRLALAYPGEPAKCFKTYIQVDSKKSYGDVFRYEVLKDRFGQPNWASAHDNQLVCVSRDLKVFARRSDYSGNVIGTSYADGNKPPTYTLDDIKRNWTLLTSVSQDGTGITSSWFLQKRGHREFLLEFICVRHVLEGHCIEQPSEKRYFFIANEPDFLRFREIYKKRMKSARYCWPINADGSKLQCVGG